MARVIGRRSWEGSRDKDGHREYKVSFLVRTNNLEGPQSVTFAPGLPWIGAPWTYGTDSDPWAFCTPYLKVTPLKSDEPNFYWRADYKFTTIPMTRCNDTTIQNPLAEPARIGGSFTGGTKEVTQDKDGNEIVTTSFEPVEIDTEENLPTVRIEQNDLVLGLDVFSPMVNRVNSAPLWGMPARHIKLNNVTWERKLWGVCSFYYTRTYEFSVDPEGFDRDDIPNKGDKVINGAWSDAEPPVWQVAAGASVNNPKDFIRRIDPKGNYTDGFIDSSTGGPSSTATFLPTQQIAKEANFLLLGIPTSLA